MSTTDISPKGLVWAVRVSLSRKLDEVGVESLALASIWCTCHVEIIIWVLCTMYYARSRGVSVGCIRRGRGPLALAAQGLKFRLEHPESGPMTSNLLCASDYSRSSILQCALSFTYNSSTDRRWI